MRTPIIYCLNIALKNKAYNPTGLNKNTENYLTVEKYYATL
ncbi:MAG: hypothetical protein AAFO04_10955 [Cyanobacteria bacterium J06592_8]